MYFANLMKGNRSNLTLKTTISLTHTQINTLIRVHVGISVMLYRFSTLLQRVNEWHRKSEAMSFALFFSPLFNITVIATRVFQIN